jgi:nucleotide-binding universal stress UspA family protein
MYRKIAVPLDGSKVAEQVLPYVEEIAKGCGTEELVLISVTERVVGRAPALEGQEVYGGTVSVALGKKQSQAERYIERIAKRLAKKGLKTKIEVLLGHPSEEIIMAAESNDCDLIAIASHGRSGISRWVHSIGAFGGVADKVLRASRLPILLVKVTPGS